MSRFSAFVPLLLAAACALPREEIASQSAAIQGGTPSASDTFAVAVLDESGGVCSGTMLAPNLVLTARHCVAEGGGYWFIDCDSDTFEDPWPASAFRVSADENADYDSAPFRVKKILVPSSTEFCGQDIALLVLQENVPSSAATVAVPQLTPPAVTEITAIGYGATSPFSSDEGARRRRNGVPLVCIPGDADIGCDPRDYDMVASEIASGNGLCGGDSGSGAYVLGGPQPIVIGVLSRASDSGAQCSDAVFVRTDSHASFLVAGAKEAAAEGGYALPAWAGEETNEPADPPDETSSGDEQEPEEAAPAPVSTTTTTSGCSAAGAPSASGVPLLLLAMCAVGLRRRRA